MAWFESSEDTTVIVKSERFKEVSIQTREAFVKFSEFYGAISSLFQKEKLLSNMPVLLIN